MTSDGEVKQKQHFSHLVDTICHPKSGYVTTKLHGTSTCRYSNNAIFSDRAIFKFPAVYVCRPVNLAAKKIGNMAALLNSLFFFVYKISFLPKYRVIYYAYIVKGAVGYNVIGVYRWILPKR